MDLIPNLKGEVLVFTISTFVDIESEELVIDLTETETDKLEEEI